MTAAAWNPWRALRIDRDFRLFWISRTVSYAGSAVTMVALPVLVYGLTRSPLITGLTTLVEALPYLVFGLVAGALADRWDRRRTMVVGDVTSAALIASIPLAQLAGLLSVGQVLLVALGVPIAFVFFDAAAFGVLPAIVGRERIASANSVIWSSSSLVEIAAPATAGAALAVIGAAQLLWADATSYLLSSLALRLIATAVSARRPVSAPADLGIREGIAWLWAHPGVRTMTLVGAAQSFGGGAFVALTVVWADRALNVRAGNWRLGALYAAWSIGGLAAALLLPVLLRRLSAARITLRALPASAILGLACAVAPNWWLGALGWCAWGVAYMLVVTNSISYRQEVTPDALMGRVNSAGRMLSWGAGWPLGALGGGIAADLLDVRAALALCAGPIVLAAIYAWRSPLRHDQALWRVSNSSRSSTVSPPQTP